MIIQNSGTSQAAQAAPPARRVSDDAPSVVAAAARKVPEAEASSRQLQNAVGVINRAMQLSSHNLKFSVDPDTRRSVVQVVDTETGDLIRQIPSKEALAIASSIDQFLQRGTLLRQKA